MYKIGDKVETPLGIGVVVGKRVAMRHDDIIFEVNIKNVKIDFRKTQVIAYKSAHEKLIEMWWEEEQETTIKNNKRYDKGNDTIYIDLVKKTYEVYGGYEPCKVDLTLSRILTQYLEELE